MKKKLSLMTLSCLFFQAVHGGWESNGIFLKAPDATYARELLNFAPFQTVAEITLCNSQDASEDKDLEYSDLEAAREHKRRRTGPHRHESEYFDGLGNHHRLYCKDCSDEFPETFVGGLIPPLPKVSAPQPLAPDYVKFIYQRHQDPTKSLTGGDAWVILQKLYDNPNINFGELLLLLDIILFNTLRMATEDLEYVQLEDEDVLDYYNAKIELLQAAELLFALIIYSTNSPFKPALEQVSGRIPYDDYTQAAVSAQDIGILIDLCVSKINYLPTACKRVNGQPFIQRLSKVCIDILQVIFQGVLDAPSEEQLDRARIEAIDFILSYLRSLDSLSGKDPRYFSYKLASTSDATSLTDSKTAFEEVD